MVDPEADQDPGAVPVDAVVGRVVEGGTGRPIRGAEVRTGEHDWRWRSGRWVEQEGVVATTGADGSFELALPRWTAFCVLVTAPGFAPGLFELPLGAARRHELPPIELDASARILGRVEHADWPDPEDRAWMRPLSIEVSVDGRGLGGEPVPDDLGTGGLGEVTWRRRLAMDGTWSLPDLPAGVPLNVELRGAGWDLVRSVSNLVIPPGEEHSIGWRLGREGGLRGHVVLATDGRPLPGVLLWVVREPTLVAQARFDRDTLPDREVRSDGAGWFEVEGLGPGEWLIGPAPGSVVEVEVVDGAGVDHPVVERATGEASAAGRAEVGGLALVPRTTRVGVGEEGSDVRLDLAVHPGLFIEGRVLGPEGLSPRAAAHVCAVGWDSHVCCEVSVGGEFRLGPLLPGEYEVQAWSSHLGPAEPRTAGAGERGVILQLQPGGSISGRVELPDDFPSESAAVTIWSAGWDGEFCWLRPEGDGSFLAEGLGPGSYRVMATTDSAAGLSAELELAPGQDLEGVEVPLGPAGTLVVRNRTEDLWLTYCVTVDGVELFRDVLDEGGAIALVLPVGLATVTFFDWDDEEAGRLGMASARVEHRGHARVAWPPE